MNLYVMILPELFFVLSLLSSLLLPLIKGPFIQSQKFSLVKLGMFLTSHFPRSLNGRLNLDFLTGQKVRKH